MTVKVLVEFPVKAAFLPLGVYDCYFAETQYLRHAVLLLRNILQVKNPGKKLNASFTGRAMELVASYKEQQSFNGEKSRQNLSRTGNDGNSAIR